MDWRFSTFLLFLFALLIGMSWATSDTGLCSSPYVLGVLKDHTKDGALNCLDFWLNRYQTLIGAFVAVGAAALAWLVARKQIIAMEQQNRIALGDLSPEFLFESTRKNPRITQNKLTIINENRRKMRLTAIELLDAPDVVFVVYDTPGGNLRQISSYPYAVRYTFDLPINGTRPGAPIATAYNLDLWVVWSNDCRNVPAPEEPPRVMSLRFILEYEFMGGDRRRESATIDTEIALRG